MIRRWTRNLFAMVVPVTLAVLAISPPAQSGTHGGTAAFAVGYSDANGFHVGGEQCIQRNNRQMRNSCLNILEVVYDIPSSCYGFAYNTTVHVWGQDLGTPINLWNTDVPSVTCRTCNYNASQSSGNCSNGKATVGAASSQDLNLGTFGSFAGGGANEITVDCSLNHGAAIHSMDVTGANNACLAGYM
jgi:hypothetical protein